MPHLPRILEASGSADPWSSPWRDAGLLLRDTTLPALIGHSGRAYTVAVDCDSVEGLSDDRAAAEFLVARLGFRIAVTRHAAMAEHVASLGGLALLKVFALDSEGLNHSLEGHPRRPGIGSAVLPGVVLPHLEPELVARLPRPILAYGLLVAPADISECLTIAESVVLRRDAIAGLAAERTDRTAGDV
jgi:glycerol-3-phosphate responsive antiterminator